MRRTCLHQQCAHRHAVFSMHVGDMPFALRQTISSRFQQLLYMLINQGDDILCREQLNMEEMHLEKE